MLDQRILDEKHMDLEEAKKHIEALKRSTADQKTEVTIFVILNRDGSLMTVSEFSDGICMFTLQQITQLSAHISELNLHAEAQAREYMHKVKMVPN